MADNVDKFGISLDLDVSGLQAELIKAQNELRGFQTQLKKSTDTGEIAKLTTSIGNLEGKIEHIGGRLGDMGKKTGDATQSLINFSRIAQDAPYGIQGIANNLNPMVESFQSLAATEGGTKKALLAMVEGLTGPAGIGVAIGIVSSLAVAFSSKISKMFETPTEKLKEFKEELNKLNADIYSIVGSAQANRAIAMGYSAIAGSDNYSLEQRKTALKYLKDIYKDNKEIQDLTIETSTQYMNFAINRAAKQQEYIGKEKNNAEELSVIYTKINKIEGERNAALKNVKQEYGAGGVPIYDLDAVRKRINDTYDAQIAEVKKKLPDALKAGEQVQAALVGFATPDTKTKDKIKTGWTDDMKGLFKDINAYIQEYKDISHPFKNEYLQRKATIQEYEINKGDIKKGTQLPKDLPQWFNEYTSAVNKNDDAVKQQLKDYKDFANLVSRTLTQDIMGLWDSIKSGENVLDSIGNMFVKFGEQLAAAAIQAALFSTVMNILAPGSTSFGFSDIFSQLLGVGIPKGIGATGGAINPSSVVSPNTSANAGSFVLKGNDLVLALQRSNYSLDLRRGA